MKKILAFLISMFSTLALCALVLFAAFSYAYYGDEHEILLNDERYTVTDNFLYVDKKLDIKSCKEILATAEDFILPEVNSVVHDGWKLVFIPDFEKGMAARSEEYLARLSANISDDVMEIAKLQGVTDTVAKIIYVNPLVDNIDDMTQAGREQFIASIIHEYGHVVNYYLGEPIKQAEFVELYNKYKNQYTPLSPYVLGEYVTSSPTEFFAGIFADYHLDKENFAAQYPELSKFIIDNINCLQDFGLCSKFRYGSRALRDMIFDEVFA